VVVIFRGLKSVVLDVMLSVSLAVIEFVMRRDLLALPECTKLERACL
jgi:hypothetical protein